MNNVARQKICIRCQQPFAPRTNSASRCDPCCTFTCEGCGNSFVSRRKRRVRFCSLNCANVWQGEAKTKEQARARTIDRRGRGNIQRCETCQEPFYVPGWRTDRDIAVRYCSHDCRNYSADATRNPKERFLHIPTRKGVNSLEMAGRAILDSLSITYLEQQIIGGKFVVDVLLPDERVIIQWDGDFWHANPAKYTTLYQIQELNIKRDRACNAYLVKCDYRVLRFWESDVHNRPSWVASEIARALESSAST